MTVRGHGDSDTLPAEPVTAGAASADLDSPLTRLRGDRPAFAIDQIHALVADLRRGS